MPISERAGAAPAPRRDRRRRAGADVAGRIVKPEGTTVPATGIEAWSVTEDGDWHGRYENRAALGADGRFVIRDVVRGRIGLAAVVVVGERVFEARQVVETGRGDIVLTLAERPPPTEGLEVLVLDPRGRPAPSGTARYDGGCRSFRDGRVEEVWTGLDERLAVEVFGVPGCGAGRLGPIVPKEHRLVLRLPPEEVVAGIIVDDRGAPVPGARLWFRAVWPGTHEVEHAAVTTGPDGRFRAAGLGPWSYAVDVLPPRAFAPPPRLEVETGRRDVRIVLARGARARATVLEGLEPGREVRIRARAPRDRDDLERTAETTARPGDVTLRFERGWVLRLRVVDRDGNPLSEARVRWRSISSDDWTDARADGAGGLVLRDLEERRLVVRAAPRDGSLEAAVVREQIVVAGDGEVTIEIDVL